MVIPGGQAGSGWRQDQFSSSAIATALDIFSHKVHLTRLVHVIDFKYFGFKQEPLQVF